MNNIELFYDGVKKIRENNVFLVHVAKSLSILGVDLSNELEEVVQENEEALTKMKMAFTKENKGE
jgi:hypothetical protein